MISSDYIPINKKKHVSRLIEFEAKIRALEKKIKVYEDLLKEKLVHNHLQHVTQLHAPQINHATRDENDDFNNIARSYISEPDKHAQLITTIVNRLIEPKRHENISEVDVKKFLHDF